MLTRDAVSVKLIEAARAAAKVVMAVYVEEDHGAELKGPNDPVTRADKEANALILEHLERNFPGIPIVAEESPASAYADFGKSDRAFFVDPVDGTREFIARNGEFAVMIGYAEEGKATVGVILCPALDKTYVGIVGQGAFMADASTADTDEWTPIHVSKLAHLEEARGAVSRFHRSKTVDERLQRLHMKELVAVGSAGLKGVRVADGTLDFYAHPSTGNVKLWDACAPDAIVRAAGGILTDGRGRPFDYRGAVTQGEGTIAGNPLLHAEAVRRLS